MSDELVDKQGVSIGMVRPDLFYTETECNELCKLQEILKCP